MAHRLAAARAELAALPLQVAPPSRAGGLNVAPPTAATRLGELLEQITALEVLTAAPALRPDALVAAPAPLTAGERAALADFATRTSRALAELPWSRRPDWGWAMLVGMARLSAVDTSLASNRLLTLDAWPPTRSARRCQPACSARLLRGHGRAQQRRARTRADQLPCRRGVEEGGYARLESAVSRAADVVGARADQASPRAAPDPLMPTRPALRRDLVVALPPPDEAARGERAARDVAAAYREDIKAWRG